MRCTGRRAGESASRHCANAHASCIVLAPRESTTTLTHRAAMISILQLQPNVLAYRVEGKLEREDIDRIFAEVDRKLATGEKIRVYAEVHSITGMTLEAIWQDLKLGIQRMNLISKIERAALVTDLGWLRTAVAFEEKMFGGLSIRAFQLSQQMEAQAWVQSDGVPG